MKNSKLKIGNTLLKINNHTARLVYTRPAIFTAILVDNVGTPVNSEIVKFIDEIHSWFSFENTEWEKLSVGPGKQIEIQSVNFGYVTFEYHDSPKEFRIWYDIRENNDFTVTFLDTSNGATKDYKFNFFNNK